MFELRALAEPLVAGDVPGKLVVYLPGLDVEPRASVLLELELASERITEHYLQAKKADLGIARDLDSSDLHMHLPVPGGGSPITP